MIRLFYFVLISCLIVCSDLLSQNVMNIFPDSALGWKKSSQTRIYVGDELFSLIDGGAEIFYEYGFKQVAAQSYQKGDKTINVEVYEMKDPFGAFGIFSLQTLKTGESIKFSCDASSGEGFFLFWKGSYYIALSASSYESPEENKNGLMAIAENIQSKISTAEKPELTTLLSDKFRTKVVFLHGHLSLYNLYIFDTKNIFNLKEGYFFEKNNIKNFIFEYNDEEEALKQYQRSSEELAVINKLKKSSDKSEYRLFKENNGNWINILRLGKYIFVSVSKKAKTPESLLREIKSILIK